jgi:hypothetical protein
MLLLLLLLLLLASRASALLAIEWALFSTSPPPSLIVKYPLLVRSYLLATWWTPCWRLLLFMDSFLHVLIP